MIEDVGGHAGAGVGDHQHHVVPGLEARVVARIGAAHVHVRGLQEEPAACGHGVARVHREVHDHLFELGRIHSQAAQGRVEAGGQLDVFADEPREHGHEAGEHGVQVEHARLHYLAAAEGQDLAREGRGSLHRLSDAHDVLRPRVGKPHASGQERRVARDHGEDVVEVVGDASRELAHRLEALGLVEGNLEALAVTSRLLPGGHVGGGDQHPDHATVVVVQGHSIDLQGYGASREADGLEPARLRRIGVHDFAANRGQGDRFPGEGKKVLLGEPDDRARLRATDGRREGPVRAQVTTVEPLPSHELGHSVDHQTQTLLALPQLAVGLVEGRGALAYEAIQGGVALDQGHAEKRQRQHDQPGEGQHRGLPVPGKQHAKGQGRAFRVHVPASVHGPNLEPVISSRERLEQGSRFLLEGLPGPAVQTMREEEAADRSGVPAVTAPEDELHLAPRRHLGTLSAAGQLGSGGIEVGFGMLHA